jgi:hypothetical protein
VQSGEAAGRGIEFEHFVMEILTHSADFDLPERMLDGGYDFAPTYNGQPLIIEVKVTTPQTTPRLRDFINQLVGQPPIAS